MLYNEALELAKPTLKKVVDLLSEKNYKAIENIAELEHLTPELIKEIMDEYLELNDLTLQMSFLFGDNNELKPIFLDLHVM